MTLPEAITSGLLIHHEEDGRTELRTPKPADDPAFPQVRLWWVPERPRPWRWASCSWQDDGRAGQSHGGEWTLSRCLLMAYQYLRARTVVAEEAAE